MKRRYVIRDEEHEGGKCMSSLRTKGLGKSVECRSYVFAWRITYAVDFSTQEINTKQSCNIFIKRYNQKIQERKKGSNFLLKGT